MIIPIIKSVTFLGVALLTRAAAARATKHIAQRIQTVEDDAQLMSYAIQNIQADPDDVAQEHNKDEFDQLGRIGNTGTGQRRFVAALVVAARAEFGAPLPEMQTGLLRAATYLKVRTYLLKWCKDRFVRARDIGDNVDDATEMWFVPTRRDVRRALIAGSGEVAAMRAAEKEAHNRPLGALMRGLMQFLGHNVSQKTVDPYDTVLPVLNRCVPVTPAPTPVGSIRLGLRRAASEESQSTIA